MALTQDPRYYGGLRRDKRIFSLNIQELSLISPENPFWDAVCMLSPLLITESEIWPVTQWSVAQMHTAQKSL